MNEQVEVEVSGRIIQVRRLTVQEIHDVGNELFNQARRRLTEDAEVAGLEPEDRLAKIKELREEWSNGVEVLRQSYTRTGAAEFIKRALKNADEDASAVDEERDLKTLVVASCVVCGLPDPFDHVEEEPVKVDEDEEEIFDNDQE